MHTSHDYKKYIKSVTNFPKKGVLFKDITPLLANPSVFHDCILDLSNFLTFNLDFDAIVCLDARGFIFACPVAFYCKKPIVPVRKALKLPRECYHQDFTSEYGKGSLHVHKDEIIKFNKVVIMDDILATGGTVHATVKLLEQTQCQIAGILVLANLNQSTSPELMEDYNFYSMIEY